MKLRRVLSAASPDPVLQVETARGWVSVGAALTRIDWGLSDDVTALYASDAVALLGAEPMLLKIMRDVAAALSPDPPSIGNALLPFDPRSYRDFMLYEQHAIDAARGFVRQFMPKALPAIRAYEKLTGKPFPALKPKPLWYRQPIYYMGNHLAFVPSGSEVEMPAYTQALDYELELGFVLAKPLLDATPEQAEAAIGGFVVFNDLSARDVQRDEMDSGFGPQKSKHFCNLMSAVVVSADEILPRWQQLTGSVMLNNAPVATLSSAGAKYSLGEALAHASRGEQLYPGEFFATGTWPGGCGIEQGRLLKRSDRLKLTIDGIGVASCRIV